MRAPDSSYCAFDVVAIVGSAGSTQVILDILKKLPVDFPSATIVCQHFNSSYFYTAEYLKDISLNLQDACGTTTLEGGQIYIAPPNHHTFLSSDCKMSFKKANVDLFSGNALFSSVANAFGRRAIGVVLSGLGNDGAEGVINLKKNGARILVQRSPRYPGMPNAALATGCVDFCLSTKGIVDALISMVMVQGAADVFGVPLPSWAH